MRFNPADKIDNPVIKEGRYFFKVANANEQISKTSGNEMLKLVLAIKINDYNSIEVFDYLVNTPKALFKIEQFCKSVGLDFNNGNLVIDDVLGTSGEAIFMYEPDISTGRKYLKVQKYVSQSEVKPAVDDVPTGQSNDEVLNTPVSADDLPF